MAGGNPKQRRVPVPFSLLTAQVCLPPMLALAILKGALPGRLPPSGLSVAAAGEVRKWPARQNEWGALQPQYTPSLPPTNPRHP